MNINELHKNKWNYYKKIYRIIELLFNSTFLSFYLFLLLLSFIIIVISPIYDTLIDSIEYNEQININKYK